MNTKYYIQIDYNVIIKREGWKDSTLVSSTIFLIFTMQKRWQWKYVSAKEKRDYVSLIGAYEFNGIEPYAQMLKDVIQRKSFKQQCINYFGKNFSLKTLILLFLEKGSLGEKKTFSFL